MKFLTCAKGNLSQMQGLDMKKNIETKCLYIKMANGLESGVYCLNLPNKNHPKNEPWNSPTLNPISVLIYTLVEAASHLTDTLLLEQKKCFLPSGIERESTLATDKKHSEGRASTSWGPSTQTQGLTLRCSGRLRNATCTTVLHLQNR